MTSMSGPTCWIALVLLLCASVRGLVSPRYEEPVATKSYPEQWFTQKLDHFNAEEKRTFQQRFYVNSENWDKQGPVLLYINGEGPVSGPPALENVVLLAQRFHALIVTLEHRYYGKSQPLGDWSTPNLRFLSSRQALVDLATFVTDFTAKNAPNSKILTYGGSYSGALSAWFRLKFPQVTVGAISSSGVVNAILDFTAFDQQVATSAGPECSNALRMVTHLVETEILKGGQSRLAIKAKFNAATLVDDGDFFYFLADSMAEGVQYGYQDYLCLPLLAAIHNNETLVNAYVNYTKNIWGNRMGVPAEYATAFQQNTTVDAGKADRQWWFQTCTEFGYFQNAPAVGSIRSRFVNMTYHKTHCANVFGEPLWPDTEATNLYYGGDQTAATNVFFANGSQDPWQRASVEELLSSSEPWKVIKCGNCGHCVDLAGCPGGCKNTSDLDLARTMISKHAAIWLSGDK